MLYINYTDSNDKEFLDMWRSHMDISEKTYLSMIDIGVSPEVARGVLPLDLKTELAMTGSLHSWFNLLALRMDTTSHPQARELAMLINNKIHNLVGRVLFNG
ncbi:MAG: FAD-dependent thymidylate synthase [Bacteroidia bacterium]|nr:FAD-dependent thymidylate synthase [Bacteroidia bacterium]